MLAQQLIQHQTKFQIHLDLHTSAGGATLTSVTPTLSSSTAVCDFADVSFTSASFTANGALIYNSSQSNKAVAAIAFGSDKTVTSGTFTIQFPTADADNAIIRISIRSSSLCQTLGINQEQPGAKVVGAH